MSASLRNQPRHEANRSVSRAGQAEAERAIAADAGEVLGEVHGVQVQRTSSAKPTPIVRGLTGSRVLLLFDGLRLNDALTRTGGNALLALLDPEASRGLEVLRGPASVIYGSDALGGVVQVFPWDPNVPAEPDAPGAWTSEAWIRRASAERAVQVRGNVQAAVPGAGARLSGGVGRHGAVRRGGGLGEQPFTGHDAWAASARLVAQPAKAHKLGLAYHGGRILDAPRSDLSAPGDVRRIREQSRDLGYVWYRARPGDGDLRVKVRAGLARRFEARERERTGAGTTTLDAERDTVTSVLGAGRVQLVPWGTSLLTLGGDVAFDLVASEADAESGGAQARGRGRYVDGSRYGLFGLFGLLDQPLGECLGLELGVRATLVDVEAPTDPAFADLPALGRTDTGVVGSAGLRYDAAGWLALVVSVLGGFRAPNLEDFQALGTGARGLSVPNPELREERSWTLDAGAKLAAGGWSGELFGYATTLSGLIDRVPASYRGADTFEGRPVFTRINASSGALLGAEADVAYRWPSGLHAGASAWTAWGETERPGSGNESATVTEPASKVPPPTSRLTVGYRPPDGTWWVAGVLEGALPQDRLSASDTTDVRICPDGPNGCTQAGDFLAASVRGGAALADGLTLLLAVDNLTDAAYRPFASGVDAPGLGVIAALRGRL